MAYVPDDAFRRRGELKSSEWDTYFALCMLRNHLERRATVSLERLAKTVGVEPKTIQNARAALKKKGWITYVGETYEMTVGDFVKVDAAARKKAARQTEYALSNVPQNGENGTSRFPQNGDSFPNLGKNLPQIGECINKDVPTSFTNNVNNIPSPELRAGARGAESEYAEPFDRQTIYRETIFDGLCAKSRFNLNILPQQTDWLRAVEWAYSNGFTTADFLECFDLLKAAHWRKGRVTPDMLINFLPELERLRSEAEQITKGHTDAQQQPTPGGYDERRKYERDYSIFG